MTEMPPITEDVVRAHVGARSFARGEEYFRQGAIRAPQVQGHRLKGYCEGTRPDPYRLWVRVDEHGVAGGYCSCPVGLDGSCKHAAALLLTWLHHPEQFEQVPDLATELSQRPVSELVAALLEMIRQEPRLEAILDPAPAQSAERRLAVTVETYRRQAEVVFGRYDEDDWRAAGHIASDLWRIQSVGDEFQERGDCANAAAVYEGVVRAVLANYESVHDEDELATVANECVEGLGSCLAAVAPGSPLRPALLRALVDVFDWDCTSGGYGIGAEAPEIIARQAAPEERRVVAGWLRAGLGKAREGGNSDRARDYGGALLKVEGELLEDEAFLRLCRESGQKPELVDRLLALGRVEEALAEAATVEEYRIEAVADLFVAHEQFEVVERMMIERARRDPYRRALGWLGSFYRARGRLGAALDVAEEIFRQSPTLGHYQEARELAQQAGHWVGVRQEMLAFLVEKDAAEVLAEIHLDEGEMDLALGVVEQAQERGHRLGGIALRVAEAAEGAHPRAALAIFRAGVEGEIERRDRNGYREASRLLARVKQLHLRLGQEELWRRDIEELRQRYRRFSALQDERRSAGL